MGRYPISVVKFPYIFVYNIEGLMTIIILCLFIHYQEQYTTTRAISV